MKLNQLCEKANALNKQMYDALVKEIEPFGLIRTDKWNDKDKSTLFCFVYDETLGEYREYPVMAIAVTGVADDGTPILSILPSYSYQAITLDFETDDDILDMEEWEDVYGGNLLINGTLYNICENIKDYLPKR